MGAAAGIQEARIQGATCLEIATGGGRGGWEEGILLKKTQKTKKQRPEDLKM